MSRILVTGGASGLGKAMVEALDAAGHRVLSYDLKQGLDVLAPDIALIEEFKPQILINCAGVNGIDMIEDVKPDLWDRVIGVNARGILLMTQACLPHLTASCGTIINVISNAAVVPMTSSVCYNASKGAALTMTKQMARELTKRWGITVFGISPNKLRGTEMSRQIDAEVVRTRGWTMEEAKRYQIAGLLSGSETDPRQIAELVAFLLGNKERHAYLTGCNLQLGL